MLAYLDPVSGGVLLQLLVAGLIGVVGFFLSPFRRILGWWGRRHRESSEQETGGAGSQNDTDDVT